jgi:hypothetical protein
MYYLLVGQDPSADKPDRNYATLRSLVSEWPSRDAAETLLALYESGSKLDPALRPQTVEAFWSEVIRTITYLADSDSLSTPIDVLRNAAFSYAGPNNYQILDDATTFRSRAGHVEIVARQRGIAGDTTLDVLLELHIADRLMVPGANNTAEARAQLNRQVDRKLARFGSVSRLGSTGQGYFFQAQLLVQGVELSRAGSIQVVEIIGAAVSGIEEWGFI